MERYARKQIRATWCAEIERQLKVEINHTLGAKQIGSIARADILKLVEGIVDRGSPTTGNRVFATLRQIFNFALDRDLISISPMPRKAPAPETKRDRVLSDGEIRLAWQAFDAQGAPFGEIAKLLLLTGARRSEIAKGTWAEIDLDARTWMLPGSRTKNGQDHLIPLSDTAVGILKGLRRIESRQGFVFTSNGRKPVSGFSKAKIKRDAIVAMNAESPVANWTLHDLRRTATTKLQEMKVQFEVRRAVQNHKMAGVAGVYDRYEYQDEKRAALDAWARRLEVIISGVAPSNVVPLGVGRG